MALRGVGIVLWFCREAAGRFRCEAPAAEKYQYGRTRSVARIPDCKVTTNKRKHQNKFAAVPYFRGRRVGGGERGFPGARNGERE